MIVFLDCETGGLDPMLHPLIEVAWCVDGMAEVKTLVLPHNIFDADEKALEINGYHERGLALAPRATDDEIKGLWGDLAGNTLCAANPAFDAAFLKEFFRHSGVAGDSLGQRVPDPWKYRLFDIEAYAAGVLGLNGDPIPGLRNLSEQLTAQGHIIHEPDHTAAGDVRTLMDCYSALRKLQAVNAS